MSQVNSSQRNIENKSKNNDYPSLGPHFEKILIIVKASPNPSDKYRETVCTVGMTENGRLIRLYPIPFRYMGYNKRFSKYQWIQAEIRKRPFEKDFRKDSYQPNTGTIKPLGKPLPAGKWTERKRIILPAVCGSLEEIKDNYDKDKISLGIFKPKKITRFVIEQGTELWSPKHQKVLSQQVLFGKQPKELQKTPFNFSYEFECENEDCKGHKMQIIDWEIYELYRRMKDKDSHLTVGSVYPHPTFVVLGVFWPPK